MTVLVERGARVDVADGDGWTPLIEAVVFQPGIESNDDHRVRRRELVDLLLTHGASVDRRTADGMTPLMLAAAQGHMDIIRLLLKKGCRPHSDRWCGAQRGSRCGKAITPRRRGTVGRGAIEWRDLETIYFGAAARPPGTACVVL